jgi:hypothetical protein
MRRGKRRMKEMKKMLMIVIVIIGIMLIMGAMRKQPPSEWREYVVHSGDTISSIAVEITPNSEDYRDNMRYIIKKNNIENGLIYPGQVIFVPVVKGE